MKKFADFVIENRLFFPAVILLITLFFLYQAVTKLTVKTNFPDLPNRGLRVRILS